MWNWEVWDKAVTFFFLLLLSRKEAYRSFFIFIRQVFKWYWSCLSKNKINSYFKSFFQGVILNKIIKNSLKYVIVAV